MSNPQARGRPRHADTLTPAEWRVAEGLRHGMTNRAIAERLGVSTEAVKFHVANVLSKLGFDRRSQLRSWTGVRKDSNLANAKLGCETEPRLGPIGQVARSVLNVEISRRWYQDTIGLEFLFEFEGLAFFNCDGVRLLLSQGAGGPESLLYFTVPDIRVAHASLMERGVEFISAPHLIHRHNDGSEEWMAFFKDNEGRPLAIMANVPAQRAPGE